MAEMYQSVILNFNDGTSAVFSGKAHVFPDGTAKAVRGVVFTEPKELPADCSFATMDETFQQATEQSVAPDRLQSARSSLPFSGG